MNNPIVAISTAPGQGAIALVRLSGEHLVKIVDAFFVSKQLTDGLLQAVPNKQYFGLIKEKEAILDEVMLTFFRAPKSYTGEDLIEIACHGSTYIQQKIVALCLKNGAQLAEAGEFTFRAFINGKMDLSQAEAVADLIHSENEANHKIALQNMRGGFSSELKALRKNLVRLAALMELELDFSEEDVAFADRSELKNLLEDLKNRMQQLLGSFDLGNALKKGVPVAILGAPNAGKSSLLNLLLNEEKAIVSDIAGTTRDMVEDSITLNGISYRFIDTAGLRETTDTIESIGIQRALQTAEKAEWILYLYDEMQDDPEGILTTVEELKQLNPNLKIILAQNKIDLNKGFNEHPYNGKLRILHENDFIVSHLGISTKENQGIEELKNYLQEHYSQVLSENDLIVNNLRHAQALRQALEGIERVEQGMHAQLPTDLLSFELRDVIAHLGKITGVIDPDVDILGTLFGEFCVGK